MINKNLGECLKTWKWFPLSKEYWSFPEAFSHSPLMLVVHSEQHYEHGTIPDSGLNHQNWMLQECNRATLPWSQGDSSAERVKKNVCCPIRDNTTDCAQDK